MIADIANVIADIANEVAEITNAIADIANAIAGIANAIAEITNAIAEIANAKSVASRRHCSNLLLQNPTAKQFHHNPPASLSFLNDIMTLQSIQRFL